jgi:hypothetical protein
MTTVTAAAITPGTHALLALALERRLLRPRSEFTALAIGDPLLCTACGLGVALAPSGVPATVSFLTSPPALATWSVGWLLYGVTQWRSELRTGYYAPAQAFAPTKIWHQLAVYPAFSTFVLVPLVAGLAAPLGDQPLRRLTMKSLIGTLVAAWVVANVYDRRHPRLGHPPFDWRRLRPCSKPWLPESSTLRAWASPKDPPEECEVLPCRAPRARRIVELGPKSPGSRLAI